MIRLFFLSSCSFFLAGCATSFTHRVSPPPAFETHESLYLEKVPPIAQKAYQCGPAALESVIRYWGGSADADSIGKAIYGPRTRGVFNFSLAQYAKTLGFWTEIHEEWGAEDLRQWLRKGVPPIVMLDTGTLWVRTYHFVVLKGFDDRMKIFYANTGVLETQAIDYGEFERRWKKASHWSLIVSPPEKVDWELDEAKSIELALIFEKNGNLNQAKQWLESALIKNPESLAGKFNLANIYSRSNRPEQAKILYQELLNKNPDRPEISNNLAWIYYEEGRYEDALKIVETAFKNGAPQNYDILDTAGMIYCKLGRAEDAQRAFSEAGSKVPAGDVRTLKLIQDHRNACKQGAGQ
jgi:tetratricopeptide (TPR) repeat protein